MPRPPRHPDPDAARDAIAGIGAVVRAAGPDGSQEAPALARQYAPEAIRFLADNPPGYGSVFSQP